MNSNSESIRSVLVQAGRRLKWSALLVGLSWWLVTCLGLWLVLFVLDNLLRLPAGLRLPLALGGAVVAGLSFVKRIYTVAAQQQRVERTAVTLEKRYHIPENLLINACQFEGRSLRPEEQPFVRQTSARCAGHMAAIRIADLWDRRDLARWGSGAVALLVVWGLYIGLFPRYVWNAGTRFALPLADRPPVASVRLNVIPADDVTLVEGDNLEVSAAVAGKSGVKVVPTLVWKENAAAVEPLPSAGDNAIMAPVAEAGGKFNYTFADIRRPFAFRVLAGDAYSRNVQVKVKLLPRITESVFQITPPAYVGLEMVTNPGPPSALSVLPGSKVGLALAVEPEIEGGLWKESGKAVALKAARSQWQMATLITNAGEYEIEINAPGLKRNVSLVKGAVRIETDHPPEIDFVTTDRNRLVNLSSTVKLELLARDDYGLRAIEITARTVDQENSLRSLKGWTYLGPPGNKGPVKETYLLEIDPQNFKPETAYLIEALAADFRPGAPPAKSRPIMLRVKSLNDYTPAADDPLANAIAGLRNTIFFQEKANNRTVNLKTYLEEALQNKTLADRQKEMTLRQEDARRSGGQTLGLFRKVAEARLYAGRLSPLVEGEMPWVLRDIGELNAKKPKALPGQLAEIEKRQTYILNELIALLGKIADQKQMLAKTNALPKELDTAPVVTPQEMAKDLSDDLKKFINEQERILERSKMLLDKGPEDLTDKEEQILGDLAREEAKWAKFFEEKLTDFSKLPAQDFADSSISKEVNEVYMEIKKASEDLYAKKMELAVPLEQSGLENAQELMHNLERWLPDSPDRIKWNMEEANAPADIALAELPAELEDIVGDLIDKEEEMTDDVEDVSSPWLDSIDKGAGWDAMDGPISSMSAKGVTGNMLPNNIEIGGRSGEGRTGKSSGQMVEETADGKGGRETPTRLSPSPFEQGSVKDSDKKSLGGATGGGKLAGTGAEGLRGPTAPQMQQKMPRLAEQQAKIRQEAESLALKLRRQHLPTGDLEASVNSMKNLEQAARKGDGLGVRRAFSHAMSALDESKKSLRAEIGLHRERTKLPEWLRDEIKTGIQDGVPRGYEEMISEYFRVLAEQKNSTTKN